MPESRLSVGNVEGGGGGRGKKTHQRGGYARDVVVRPTHLWAGAAPGWPCNWGTQGGGMTGGPGKGRKGLPQ